MSTYTRRYMQRRAYRITDAMSGTSPLLLARQKHPCKIQMQDPVSAVSVLNVLSATYHPLEKVTMPARFKARPRAIAIMRFDSMVYVVVYRS